MKSKFFFSLILVLAIIFKANTSVSAQTSNDNNKAVVQTQSTQTIKLKVTGVGCANDCKDIQKSVTLVNGVASCTLVGKPGANSVFEVTFNPSVVSEKEIRSAVEGTGGCSDPDARPYKVKG